MKIIVMIVLISLLVLPVIVHAETDVKDIVVPIRFYYLDNRSAKVRISGYDDEPIKTFEWTDGDDGDYTDWEPTFKMKIDSKLRDVELSIRFYYEGEREVKLRVTGYDGDATKTFSWVEADEGSSTEWESNIRYEFDITEEEEEEQLISLFKNITAGLEDSREMCYDIVRLNNESHLIAREYADLREGVGNQGAKLEECKADLTEAEDKANKYDSCSASKQICDNNYQTCSTNLESCKKSKASTPIIVGIVCLIVGYFFAKKKESVPQEFQEMGSGQMPPPPPDY